ncbi:MAG TPA: DUF1254 domain-containing protein, partial [Solirubrobacteraceae bacterium]|nr:DUF1254 domain-containing protein [Solirubrobacteraceae bacterium]
MALLLAASGPLVAAPATRAHDRDRAVRLGREAYEYGLPLLEYLRVRREQTSVRAPDGRGNAPVNQLSHALDLAGPRDRTVVAPNVDTLYSIAHLDLGREPVVLGHPSMRRRYFAFTLLDPYTNVVGYVGTRTTGSRARRTAIVWSRRRVRVPKGVRTLHVRFRRIWVIGRTVARGRSDVAAARRLMRRYALVPLSRLDDPPRPPARPPGRPRKARTPTGIAFFDALATALKRNPPPRRDRPILTRLATVGIEPGRGPTAAGVSAEVRDGLVEGFRQARAEVATRARSRALAGALASGGWYTPDADVGDYGTDYALRAEIAVAGLGANTPAEATYPIALADGEGRLLDGNHRYTVSFRPREQPPVRAFWSLTMYTLDGYL